jgi:predicted HTH transcriptional regulator
MTSSRRLVERVVEALRLGHEVRGFEVKGPGAADGPFLAKVVRAALSLGNLRDGGLIVVGVSDRDLRSMGPGLSIEQAATWESFDALSATFAEYADPPLQFHSELLVLPGGAQVCVLEISEFYDVPHLCKKGFDANKGQAPLLRRGALYVRTRRVPETSEIATAEEIRELLDLATEKRLAAYVRTADRAGVSLSPDAGWDAETEAGRFDAQREDGWR